MNVTFYVKNLGCVHHQSNTMAIYFSPYILHRPWSNMSSCIPSRSPHLFIMHQKEKSEDGTAHRAIYPSVVPRVFPPHQPHEPGTCLFPIYWLGHGFAISAPDSRRTAIRNTPTSSIGTGSIFFKPLCYTMVWEYISGPPLSRWMVGGERVVFSGVLFWGFPLFPLACKNLVSSGCA